MISYRKADLLDIIKQDGYKPLIFAINDNRSFRKFYSPETGKITRPEGDIVVDFKEQYRNNANITERNGVYILVNYLEVGDLMGKNVRLQGNIIGECKKFLANGSMHVEYESGEISFVDPLEFLIQLQDRQNLIEITREPFHL